MARKKKNGIPKKAIIAIGVIIIVGFLFIGVPYIDNTIDITDLSTIFPTGDVNSNSEFFSLPNPICINRYRLSN